MRGEGAARGGRTSALPSRPTSRVHTIPLEVGPPKTIPGVVLHMGNVCFVSISQRLNTASS